VLRRAVRDDIDDIDDIDIIPLRLPRSSSVSALVPAILPLRRDGGLLEGPE